MKIETCQVPHGLGAPVGLDPLQHVSFALPAKHRAGSLQALNSDLQAINPELQLLTSSIHGPLRQSLLAMAGVTAKAKGFLRDLQFGFPLLGELPPREGSSKTDVFKAGVTAQELQDGRVEVARQVVAAVRELPLSAVLPSNIK